MQTQSTFTSASWDFEGEIANCSEDIWGMLVMPINSISGRVKIKVVNS